MTDIPAGPVWVRNWDLHLARKGHPVATPDWADPVADDQPKPVEEMVDELEAETDELEKQTKSIDQENPTVDPH